jgi:hypothetical protein
VFIVLLTPLTSSFATARRASARAGLALLACLLAAPDAAGQVVPGEAGVTPPDTVMSLVGSARTASTFAGLFRPAVPAAAMPAHALTGLGVADAAFEGPARACDGCPKRRPIAAVGQVLVINLAFNWVNRLRNPNDEFMVTFHSWWDNLTHGFEWDFNSFQINQFGHPYQGNLYFNAGRANGLNFWESAPLAALGSATWEYFGERNHASINDFVTTTMGGIALGEMFHRAGWLIRDSTLIEGRKKKEFLAMALDPITGANRFLSGDASRVSENPPDLKPTTKVGDLEAGVQFNGEINERAVNSAGKPFLGIRLGYNDMFASPYKVPYDAFSVTLRLGGGSGITEATVRGRLYGHFLGDPLKEQRTEFLVAQAYDFEKNDIFDYGGQSVIAGLSRTFRLSDSVRLAAFGVGGPIVLGAITSPLLTATPEEEVAAEGNKRTYDFGPGAEIAGGAVLRAKGQPVARFTYGGFYIRSVSTIEGITANHYAQYLRLDVLLPLWRQLRLGVSGDYINRATYYKDLPDVHQWIPQVRFFLAKVSK